MAPTSSATGVRQTQFGLVADTLHRQAGEDKASDVDCSTQSKGKLCKPAAVMLEDLRCTKCRERGIKVCTMSGGRTRRTSCDQCIVVHSSCSFAKRKAAEVESSDEDGDKAPASSKVAAVPVRRVRYKDIDSDDNSIAETDPPAEPKPKQKQKPKPKPEPELQGDRGARSSSGATPGTATTRAGHVPSQTPRSKAKSQAKQDQAGLSGWLHRSHDIVVASSISRPSELTGTKVAGGTSPAVDADSARREVSRLERLHVARDAFFARLRDRIQAAGGGVVASAVLDEIYVDAMAWRAVEELALSP